MNRQIIGKLLFELLFGTDRYEKRSSNQTKDYFNKTSDNYEEKLLVLGYEVRIDCDPYGHILLYDLQEKKNSGKHLPRLNQTTPHKTNLIWCIKSTILNTLTTSLVSFIGGGYTRHGTST